MGPFIAQEARNAPKHAKRLDGAGRFRLPHVSSFPAELVEDFAHDLSGRLVVAADEHRRLSALELGVHHAPIADGIEGLDKASLRKLALKPFHQ